MQEKTWNRWSVVLFMASALLAAGSVIAAVSGEIYAFIWTVNFGLTALCAGFLFRDPRPIAGRHTYLRHAQRQLKV